MIKKKDFVTVLLLTIVTCGIYGYYYYYVMTRDINKMVGNDGKGTEPAMVVLLSIVTAGFYDIYWYYNNGNRIQRTAQVNGVPCEENGNTYLLWYLVGMLVCGIGPLVAMYFLIKNFNLLADAYNARTQNMA